MKKLKLQTLGLSVNDLLTREQMKKVSGGSGDGSGSGTTSYTCYATAKPGYTVTDPGSCTGTQANCNSACSTWCSGTTGCKSCSCI